jgi:hypothetical protein
LASVCWYSLKMSISGRHLGSSQHTRTLNKQTNSVALSSQANYTDWATDTHTYQAEDPLLLKSGQMGRWIKIHADETPYTHLPTCTRTENCIENKITQTITYTLYWYLYYLNNIYTYTWSFRLIYFRRLPSGTLTDSFSANNAKFLSLVIGNWRRGITAHTSFKFIFLRMSNLCDNASETQWQKKIQIELLSFGTSSIIRYSKN